MQLPEINHIFQQIQVEGRVLSDNQFVRAWGVTPII